MAEPYFPPPPSVEAKNRHRTSISTPASGETFTERSIRPHPRWRLVDRIRSGIALLCLAVAIVVLGTSAQALHVYNRTHVPADALLPLWPTEFNVGPASALVGSSAVVVAMSVVSLVSGRYLKARPLAHKAVSLGAPVVAFVAALVAMSFFYGVNASARVDTIQSWSCRWRRVPMAQMPHFGTLCEQTRAGLALAVVLVPLELVLVAAVAYQVLVIERGGAGRAEGARPKTAETPDGEKAGL